MNPVTVRTLAVLAAAMMVLGAMIPAPMGRLALLALGAAVALVPLVWGRPLLRVAGASLLAIAVGLLFEAYPQAQDEAAAYGRHALGEAPGMTFETLVVEGFLACDIPANWSRSENLAGNGEVGLQLTAPGFGRLPVTIAIDYYTTDGQYPSSDHYVQLFARPTLGIALEGEHYEEVRSATVSGRPARVFGRTKKVFLPGTELREPTTDDPRVYERGEKIATAFPVTERFVVVPSASGFYALRYSAPAESYSRYLPVFERLVDSFRALKPS